MKQENIFRFVSVRPPPLVDLASVAYIRENEVHRELTNELDQLALRNPGQTRRQLRARLVESILTSERYCSRDPLWMKWQAQAERIDRLFRAQEITPDATEFLGKASEVIGAVYGEAMGTEQFLAGPEYRNLKNLLWTSYYANVMSQGTRPEDRGGIFRLIRFLHALSATSSSDLFREVMQVISWSRLIAPDVLVAQERGTTGQEDTHGQPPDTTQPRVMELERSIEEIEAVLNYVRTVYSRNWARLAMAGLDNKVLPGKGDEKTSVPRRSGGKRTPVEPASSREGGIGNGKPVSAPPPPWMMTMADFSTHPEHLEVLQRLEVDVETTPIPALLPRLEHELAIRTRMLWQTKKRDKTVAYGPILVKVSR